MQPAQQVINRVQDDTQPNIQFVVYRKPPTGSPQGTQPTLVDLTEYTGAGNSIQLEIVSQTSSTNTNSAHMACTAQLPYADGICTYTLESGDLPDAGGDYLCDLTLTNSSGPETWFEYLRIHTRARV